MEHFRYQENALWVENIPLASIADKVGTPSYVYSHRAIVEAWRSFDDAFHAHPHKICYAVKANSNLAVLNTVAQLGSGFDIVSGGELARVIAAKGCPSQVVFSGVGKTAEEIAYALTHRIFCFNVESQAELLQLNQIAQHHNLQAPIALRVNPDVDALSHPYISTGLKENKFGVPWENILALYQQARSLPFIQIKGIACHIGSQITTLAPFMDAVSRVMDLTRLLKHHGIFLSHVDIGGGLGVCYQNETPPSIADYANGILSLMQDPALMLLLEPGRIITANAGVLITKVLLLKKSGNKQFCVVDAGMNDLIRPALYQAWHNIIPLKKPLHDSRQMMEVVGPICESADFLGKERALDVEAGEYLAICSAGAYGFVTSSNYPSRPRACEVMVKENKYQVVRARETMEQLFAQEKVW